jgi:molybdopterin-containing oxidoreductase family membrane subunit
MVPDLAAMRDRAPHKWSGKLFSLLSLGWRGDAEHWHHHQMAYWTLAGLATPLLISVHFALHFAISIVPGWHMTVFPPYFAAGATHSGLAMMLVLLIPLRRVYRLENLITTRHLEILGKFLLLIGLLLGYFYTMEWFGEWYRESEVGWHVGLARMFGPYAVLFYGFVVANVLVPQLLWFRRLRTSGICLWIIGLVVAMGVWLERYVIVISSLHLDHLPSAWGPYTPTFWDWAKLIGTFGLFLFFELLFVRALPVISIFEVRELVLRSEQAPQPPS